MFHEFKAINYTLPLVLQPKGKLRTSMKNLAYFTQSIYIFGKEWRPPDNNYPYFAHMIWLNRSMDN